MRYENERLVNAGAVAGIVSALLFDFHFFSVMVFLGVSVVCVAVSICWRDSP